MPEAAPSPSLRLAAGGGSHLAQVLGHCAVRQDAGALQLRQPDAKRERRDITGSCERKLATRHACRC